MYICVIIFLHVNLTQIATINIRKPWDDFTWPWPSHADGPHGNPKRAVPWSADFGNA